jgi:hypothetical protein
MFGIVIHLLFVKLPRVLYSCGSIIGGGPHRLRFCHIMFPMFVCCHFTVLLYSGNTFYISLPTIPRAQSYP